MFKAQILQNKYLSTQTFFINAQHSYTQYCLKQNVCAMQYNKNTSLVFMVLKKWYFSKAQGFSCHFLKMDENEKTCINKTADKDEVGGNCVLA